MDHRVRLCGRAVMQSVLENWLVGWLGYRAKSPVGGLVKWLTYLPTYLPTYLVSYRVEPSKQSTEWTQK